MLFYECGQQYNPPKYRRTCLLIFQHVHAPTHHEYAVMWTDGVYATHLLKAIQNWNEEPDIGRVPVIQLSHSLYKFRRGWSCVCLCTRKSLVW